MRLSFGYGKTEQIVEVPDKNLQAVLESNPMEHERRGPEAVRYALEHPSGAPKLRDLVRPEQKVVIITSDISRPVPSFDILPDPEL